MVQRLRSFAKRAPLALMLFALISSLVAYSFVVDFNPSAFSLLTECAWFDPAWFSLLLALLLLLVLFVFAFLVKPSSFLNGEWLADRDGFSLKKGMFFILLGAVVPCMLGFLALASPLVVGSDSAVGLLSGASDSSARVPVFGSSSGESPSFVASDASHDALPGFPARVSASLLLYAVATCAFTALFEEMLFRAVVIPCMIAKTNQMAFAIEAGALLFAAAHVELAFPFAASASAALLQASTWISLGQFVLKPIQAALFGFCTGFLYCSTWSLKLPVFVHFLFDLLYFAPSLLATGAFPSTYTSGNLLDLVLLSVSVLFLASAALRLPRGKTRREEIERDAPSGQSLSITQKESLENRTEQTR